MKDKQTVRAKARHLKEATAKLATKKQPKINEGLAFLIEDALQRSEVVIAAESISEKLQSMAEDLSTIEAKDIMPLNDALTNAFGPQVAQKFNAVATEQIRQLVTAVQTAKSGLDGEILRLKQAVEGGDVSDMGMDAGMATPPDGATPGLADEPPGAPGAPAPGAMPEGPPEAVPPGGEEDIGIPGATGPAVGRVKKESAKPKGKRVAEDMGAPRSHESVNFNTNLSNLQLFHGGAGRLAQSIANMIRTEELSEQQRKGLANVLSHLAAFSAEPAHWSGVDADKKLEMALQSGGIWKMDTPALQKIGAQLKRLAHILAAKHDGMLESNIRLLRKSSDPDALILKTFRVSLAENRDGQMAAIRTARTYAIDVEDVVAVVREAAARRPKMRVREAGEFTGSVGAEAAGTPPPQQPQQQQQGQPVSPTNQVGDGIPIFPVEQNQPAALGATPSEPTGNAVQPNPMQPANQSASTIKPQSPADMRVRQAQQKMAATQQPTAQPAKAALPNQQVPQTQQPQRPQRPIQPRQTPPLNLPGQTMTKSNPALRRGIQ